VISGYGKRIIPTATPIEFSRSEGDALIATATRGSVVQRRRIAVDAPLDRGAPDAVAEIIDGPARDEWWLETTLYAVPHPAGWTAIVTGDVSPAFDLVREPNCAIFIQTARNRPTLETLVAPGQTVVARGSDDYADWLELSYVHDELPWRQRHSLMRTRAVAMITGQSPADDFADVRSTQQELTRRAVFVP
jgi:hypothetical protein